MEPLIQVFSLKTFIFSLHPFLWQQKISFIAKGTYSSQNNVVNNDDLGMKIG